MTRGGCLCGAVRFSGTVVSSDVHVCHCGICRRWSGHLAATVWVSAPQVDGEVRWYRTSDAAQRGFCPICGSGLFCRPDTGDYVAVLAGAVDQPTGLHLAGHVFAADKGDYYQIVDDLPKEETV